MHGTDAREVRCSVVLPCRNGAATLARQLDALRQQRASVRFEVIVADNGSVDGSVAVARQFAPLVRVVDAARARGINVARNAGIRVARGELVLMCDADDLVHPGWVEAFWRAYVDGAALLGGSMRLVSANGVELGWQRRLNDDLRFRPWPNGANCGFAKVVLDRVGALDETLRGGADDTEFFWRAQLAGFELVHVDDAVVDYVARSTLRGVFKQRVGYGRSQALLYRRFSAHGMPRAGTLLDRTLVPRLVDRVVVSDGRRRDVASVVRFAGTQCGRLIGSMASRRWYF